MSDFEFKPYTKVFPKTLEEAKEIIEDAKKQGWTGTRLLEFIEHYIQKCGIYDVVLYFEKNLDAIHYGSATGVINWDYKVNDVKSDYETFTWPPKPVYPFNIGDTFVFMFNRDGAPMWEVEVLGNSNGIITLGNLNDGYSCFYGVDTLLGKSTIIENYKEFSQKATKDDLVPVSNPTPITLENLSSLTRNHSDVSFCVYENQLVLCAKSLEVNVTGMTLEEVKFIIKLVEAGGFCNDLC